MEISELHIQRAWQHQLFEKGNLFTTQGEAIEIDHPGYFHRDEGPDFFHAHIRIGDTLWAGNVEIHHRSSEWYQHGHDHQSSYNNVILHVVLEEDRIIYRNNGEKIPCFVMQMLPEYKDAIESWERSNHWLRCGVEASQISGLSFHFMLQRLAIERLEYKSEEMKRMLKWSHNDWRHVFYYLLARSFGGRINSEPMEQLARSISLSILSKEHGDRDNLEALFFGQAGLLPNKNQDKWVEMLSQRYRFLQNKYGLSSMKKGVWKFMRTRPTNFPTVRIAQFVSLLYHSQHLLSQCMEADSIKQIRSLLLSTPSSYWNDHFRFEKKSVYRVKKTSRNFIDTIIINTIIPFLMVYGESQDRVMWKEKALRWLESLPCEKNYITSTWIKQGFVLSNAMDSQALIELHHRYCIKNKCLECGVGEAIFEKLKS